MPLIENITLNLFFSYHIMYTIYIYFLKYMAMEEKWLLG